MESLRALLCNGRTVERKRSLKNGGRDPRRRFVRENRISVEQLEAKVVLANTSADGAFSVLLDNAPGDVNGFDGNLALYQSGLVYNSKTVGDAVIQFAGTLHAVNGNKPTSVSAAFKFNDGSPQTFWWDVDAGANINDDVLFRVPAPTDPLATGGYPWEVDLTFHYSGSTYSPTGAQDYSGVYAHVDRSTSEFGKGWYHEDLHELKLVNPKTSGGKVYLITGYGEPTRFDYNGTVYTREAGDQFFYKLTRTDGTDTYYTLIDKYGTELKFKDTGTTNTSAKLESIFDASGNERRYTYTSGKLTEIKYMPTGDTTTFAYSGGYLTTITEAVGASRYATVSISNGQLASITLPDPDDFTSGNGPLASPVWSLEYSGTTGRITKTVDPVGSTSVFTYGTGGVNETISSIKQGADTSYLTPYNNATLGGTQGSPGTLKAVEDTFGQFTDERSKVTKFEANALGHITKITDDDGNATTFVRDPAEGWLTKITTVDPDAGGALAALEISYTYDTRGNRKSETKRAAGSSTILAQQTWEYEVNDDYGLPKTHIDELGRVTKFVIGPKSGSANERGKILSMTQIVGIEDNSNATETDDATTKYTYTTVAGHVGLLSTATDALGRVTTYEYWTTNPHEGLLKKITYSDGTNVEHEYDDFRNRDAVLDELDHRTEILFDKLDRVIKRTDTDPDAGASLYVSPVTEFAYNAAGNPAHTTDPLGNRTFFDYDGRGRQTHVFYPRAIGTPVDHVASQTQNTYGQWTTETNGGFGGSYRHAPAGAPYGTYITHGTLTLDPTKTYQVFVTWVPSAVNSPAVRYLEYQDAWVAPVNVNQQITPSDYVDANGVAWHRLSSFSGITTYMMTMDPNLSVADGSANRVVDDGILLLQMDSLSETRYDAAGNVDKTIDQMGRVTDYTHNDLNQLISTTLPDPDTVGSGDPAPVYETQYYNNGLVKKEIDALDNETLYEPDTLGRTVRMTYADPDGGSSLVSPVSKYKYDAAGRLTYATQTEAAATVSPMDDGDTGFSTVGTWYSWSGGYNNDYVYPAGGGSAPPGDYALWTLNNNIDPGKHYEIFVTWEGDLGYNTSDARYEVLNAGDTVLTTASVDQRYDPTGENVSGLTWHRLGVFSGSAGYKVKLKTSSGGYVSADAVRIVEVGRTTQYFYDGLGYQTAVAQPKAAGAPTDTKVNNQTTPPTNWTRDTSSGYQGDHLHRDAGSASEYAEWSFSGLDTSKTYAVHASWVVKYDTSTPPLPLGASNARYEVREASSLKATFYANQKYEPADETTDTIKWSRLGLYKPGSTSLTVRLPADANGKLVADVVRLVELGPVSKAAVNKVGNLTQTVDPLGNETISLYDRRGRLTSVYEPLRDPTVTPWRPTPVDNPTNSDWTTVEDDRAYGGSYLRANSGSSSYPTYTMSVPSLSYYPTLAVMATWTPDEENISNAQFKLYDNFNNEIGTVYVDQTVAPGDYRDETGRWWAVLGVYQMIPFYTTVKVSPQIGAQADAARLIEVGDRSFKNTYNAAGELTQLTDAKNNDTWFYRDDLGRVKEEKNELNESRYFEFYANSQLKKATDRNGRVIEHFYDNLGRQTEERWKNGSTTVRSITYGYNANGQMISADDDGAKGRDYDWFYDAMGRVEEIRWDGLDFLNGYQYQLQNLYDANSRRYQRTLHVDVIDPYSDFDALTDYWWLDALGRPYQHQQWDSGYVNRLATYSYYADGQLKEMNRYNYTTGWNLLVNTKWDYDGMGRLTTLNHKNSSGNSITGYGWTYDAAGRMTSMDFTNSTYNAEDVTTFGYDRTNQLLSGERSGTTNDEAYAYDATGNRTSANGASYTTSTNNRLTNDGTFTYTYDDEGNRLTRVRISGAAADDKTLEYTWDYRNRLEKVTFKRNDGTVTKTVEYYYDMFNHLTRRDIDPDGAGSLVKLAEQFMYDGEEMIHGVPDSGSWRSFMRGPQRDMVLFEARDALRVFLGDHLNTIRDVVDTSGNIVNHLTIDSFGRRTAETNGNIEVMIGLSGRPYDEDTRLQNHLNRWYSVDTGRWISEDPIGFGGGHANLSVYVGNSPANAVDSNGLGPVPGTEKLRAAWRARHLAQVEEWARLEAQFQAEQEARQREFADRIFAIADVINQFELGVKQGGLNIVEGVTDIGTATINQSFHGPDIPDSDWAKDVFVYEEEWAHDLSTGVGGNSALILVGAAAGGGSSAPTPVRHMDPPRVFPSGPRPTPSVPATSPPPVVGTSTGTPAPPSMNAPGLPE